MAWRLQDTFVTGILDNTQAGQVTGWLAFLGLPAVVQLMLQGDFHRDIRGTQVVLRPDTPVLDDKEAKQRMQGFDLLQTGQVGDITAGREPVDYAPYPYVEWYSASNGRVVLELSKNDVEVFGKPLPWADEEPISREEQDAKLCEYIQGMADSVGAVGVILKKGKE